MKRWNCLGCLLLVIVIGCQSVLGDTGTPPPTIPPVRAESGKIRVEGIVEPTQAITMRIGEARRVERVAVTVGDRVTMDDILLNFDAADAVLAIEQAEAALAMAEAQVARLRSGPQPEYVALLNAQVAAATAVVSQSAASVAAEAAGGHQAEVEAAQARILEAQIAHDKAWGAHEDTMTCYDAELPDGTHRDICPTLGTFEEMARAEMHATSARLEAAQANLEAVKNQGWAEINVARASESVAAARLEVTRVELEKALAGPRAEEVAITEAAVDEAATTLARAQEQLEATSLTAPFDAVVTEVKVDPHDTVPPGASLVTLAALDDLRIRTRNLTELDIVQVAEAQQVAMRADAHPDVVFTGHIERIEPQGTEYMGDIIYNVWIQPDVIPDWLRWGMTIQIDIGVSAEPSLAAENTAANRGTTAIADAVIEPVWDEQIGLQIGGTVAVVAVKPGDQVKSGDRLLQLEQDWAEIAVAEAEAKLASVRMQLALAKAGPRPKEIEAAQAALEVAEIEVARAAAQRRLVATQLGESQTAAVQAELEAAQARKRTIQAHLQWAEDDNDDERVEDRRAELVAVNQQILAFEKRLEALPGTGWAQIHAAEAGVHTAEAQRDAAAARLALLEAGPLDAEIAIAETRVRQAETALASANLQWERTTVQAPSNGTVTQVNVEVGDTVAPGQSIIVIAPLDQLQVRTVNLMEYDVIGIAPDQPVTIEVDALPDRTIRGHVLRIGAQHALYRGDVTYPVLIALDEQVPELRWGMSAVVEIAGP